jgi:hypothetical protein
MIANFFNGIGQFIKMVIYVGVEWALKLLNFLGIAVFGFTAYTVIKSCKKERPIDKKSALISMGASLGALGAVTYFLKINLKAALLDFPLLTYLPYDKRTDIAQHPKWLEYTILGGFLFISYKLGKWFFKAHTISKTLGGHTIKGKPHYLILWFLTFGVLQLGYLFNIKKILPYSMPLTIVISLGVAFMYYFVFKALKKNEEKKGIVKEVITSL